MTIKTKLYLLMAMIVAAILGFTVFALSILDNLEVGAQLAEKAMSQGAREILADV